MGTSKTRPVLITEDANGRRWRHPKSYARSWSSYYGSEGGGFGSMTWKEDRTVGIDYPDIGFGYKVLLVKGLCKVLFRGRIVAIDEDQGEPDTITVSAVGMCAAFEDDVFNKVYADARTAQWISGEDASGAFQPDRFNAETGERLYLVPRKSVDFEENDYTYLRYTFPFGTVAKRLTFDYDLALPETWPGKLEVRDDYSSLWSITATESGSKAINASDNATFFEVRFYVTAAGENTAEEDTVYAKLTEVRALSQKTATVTATDVARDLVGLLEDHGIDGDLSKIAQTYRALPDTVAFDTDMTPKEIMDWCCQYGGAGDALLAWGVEMNDRDRVYLETQDLTTIRYVVKRSSGLQAQVKGDLTQSRQKVYARYTDAGQQVQRTEDLEATAEIAAYGGYFRRGVFEPNGTQDATTIADVLAMDLADTKAPKITTSFSVSDKVYTATGKAIAIDEILAGGIVMLDDFRAREATLSKTDYRTQWSSFQLVGVEIDEDAGTARLIPAGDRRSFEQLLARIAAQGE